LNRVLVLFNILLVEAGATSNWVAIAVTVVSMVFVERSLDLSVSGVKVLELLKKKRTNMYRVCTRLRKESQAKGYSTSLRWNQLAEGAMRHLNDLSTIENEILKLTKKEKERAKSYKKNLRKV
jgi:hypothetical protein